MMTRVITLVAILLAMVPNMVGQGSLGYLFFADEPLTNFQQKVVHEALISIDSRIVISLDARYLKVRPTAALSANDIRSALAARGVHVHLAREVPSSSKAGSDPIMPWTDGITSADENILRAAKEAWILANPDAYLLMQQGESPASTRPKPSDQ